MWISQYKTEDLCICGRRSKRNAPSKEDSVVRLCGVLAVWFEIRWGDSCVDMQLWLPCLPHRAAKLTWAEWGKDSRNYRRGYIISI